MQKSSACMVVSDCCEPFHILLARQFHSNESNLDDVLAWHSAWCLCPVDGGLGMYAGSKVNNEEDSLVAGRRLPFVAGVFLRPRGELPGLLVSLVGCVIGQWYSPASGVSPAT